MVIPWVWFTRRARTAYARAFCAGAHEYIAGLLALYSFHTRQYLARTWVMHNSSASHHRIPLTDDRHPDNVSPVRGS
ncbi:hypothetical protein K470DRAFT_255285 [Piedraia hortae CBS 480.64]|uniref:Uncharacterized protein n=1 Tax=Piedraia hortae CBS 480.64 TaxID=1314780 RepID=A0A6A7C6U4_9PEZI|nr:hypothetical protein K470DRAFT_255285 [Piedraia hortae CBS 480.64]